MISDPQGQQPEPSVNVVIDAPEAHIRPWVGYAIMGATVAIYGLQRLSEMTMGGDFPAMLGMKVNDYIMAGQWWRLLTPALLHGSIFHIFFNMYALKAIGFDLEGKFGNVRFALLYLSGAFAGNVVSFLFSPNPSLGASTAIFGLLGAELVFYYRNQRLFGANAKRAIQQVLTLAAINFLFGLSPGIDNWGHLGGFLGGLAYAWFSGPRLSFEMEYPVVRVVEPGLGFVRIWLGFVVVFAVFTAFVAIKITQ